MKKILMPVTFLTALLLAVLFGELLPDCARSFFYALSLFIKECMIFALPLVIFSLIFTSVKKIGIGSVKFLLLVIPLISCSNFLNTLISYMLFAFCIKTNLISSVHKIAESALSPLAPSFSFSFPTIVSNDVALLSALVLGTVLVLIDRRSNASRLNIGKLSERLSHFLESFIKRFFKILIPLMPLFIFGTALKLGHDGMISSIISQYLTIMVIFLISAYGYVFIQLFALSSFSFEKCANYFKNLLPAIVAGFGSMSSAVALPLSIKAAEENSLNKNNARIIAPCSVNIHLVGDCFFIPFVALAILLSFGDSVPSIATYIVFALHFVMAKFAVAAIPGGGIIVMLPILQNYLGFNSDMLGLITALSVLFDPFITGCNVAGNGSLAIFFDKITARSKRC
ncbi:MAG: dicarboxylate/amino acid:cation symporter [Holosporales bacterium]|jgi:Na+/H+-dicarboxylate symporter|nr:dicarboxylate/amino acid:cation symporter [Holosporales bacterium]